MNERVRKKITMIVVGDEDNLEGLLKDELEDLPYLFCITYIKYNFIIHTI
jgi:hypothetical protein